MIFTESTSAITLDDSRGFCILQKASVLVV